MVQKGPVVRDVISDRTRLGTLNAYKIIGTAREAAFDDLARLAATICGKPLALVSLVEENRQWFKAEYGLGMREMPIEDSICSRIMDLDQPTVISDTWEDPRFANMPVCVGVDALRFYAGVPLVAPNGQPLGSFCVLDREPGSLTDAQYDALRVLADQVMAQLDLRRALHQAQMLRKEADHRVKNALQSIASLTRIQARAAQGDEAKGMLETVARRIAVVAELNAELNRSDNQRIDMSEYLARISTLLQESAPEQVTLKPDIEPVDVETSEAGLIAVIVSEFATNSFKHAFPDGRAGSIRLTGRKTAPDRYTLICADDGVGIPKDIVSDGLGIMIIESAASQLGGAIAPQEVPAGHAITVEFPV